MLTEHEHLLEAVQQRLDANPQARDGRASVRNDQGSHGRDALADEDPPEVAGEMALAVLAYNLTRVMNIVGIKLLITAITA
jgi:transposase